MIKHFFKNLGMVLLILLALAAIVFPFMLVEHFFGIVGLLIAAGIAILMMSLLAANKEFKASREHREYTITLWLTKVDDAVKAYQNAESPKEGLYNHCKFMVNTAVDMIKDYNHQYGHTEFSDRAEQCLKHIMKNIDFN